VSLLVFTYTLHHFEPSVTFCIFCMYQGIWQSERIRGTFLLSDVVARCSIRDMVILVEWHVSKSQNCDIQIRWGFKIRTGIDLRFQTGVWKSAKFLKSCYSNEHDHRLDSSHDLRVRLWGGWCNRPFGGRGGFKHQQVIHVVHGGLIRSVRYVLLYMMQFA